MSSKKTKQEVDLRKSGEYTRIIDPDNYVPYISDKKIKKYYEEWRQIMKEFK